MLIDSKRKRKLYYIIYNIGVNAKNAVGQVGFYWLLQRTTFCQRDDASTASDSDADTHLFDLEQPSRVLILGPPSRRRGFVVRDGDDVAGRGGVAQVPLGGRGGGGSQVGEEGEAAGAAGGGRALEVGGGEGRRWGGERSVQGGGVKCTLA